MYVHNDKLRLVTSLLLRDELLSSLTLWIPFRENMNLMSTPSYGVPLWRLHITHSSYLLIEFRTSYISQSLVGATTHLLWWRHRSWLASLADGSKTHWGVHSTSKSEDVRPWRTWFALEGLKVGARAALRFWKWGILRAKRAEFFVPPLFGIWGMCPNAAVRLPIQKTIFLIISWTTLTTSLCTRHTAMFSRRYPQAERVFNRRN